MRSNLLAGKMDFNDSIDVLRRRKALTATLLLLTLLGTVGAGVALPWTYSASITETLLNSKASSDTLGGGNPYLSFDAAMVELANVLTLELTDAHNVAALAQQGDTASFTAQVLSQNAQNEEPFIQINVSGKSKDAVAQTLQGATASLSTLLGQLQTGMPTKSSASLETIADDSTPTRSSGAKLKPLLGLLGVGLVLTFLLPQAVEGAARRRKSRSATPSLDDQRTPQNVGHGTESKSARYSNATSQKSENFQPQWPDQRVDDNFSTQHMSPNHQSRNAKPSGPGHDIPHRDSRRYSESDGRW